MIATDPATLPRRKRDFRPPDFSLVEYSGQLSQQAVSFLSTLSPGDLATIFPVPGRYEEVRTLLAGARLLHLCLREGPLTAARGRVTFTEFVKEKRALHPEIMKFRRRIEEMAQRLSLRHPRIPNPQEVSYAA